MQKWGSAENGGIIEDSMKFCENPKEAEKRKRSFPWGHNIFLLPLTLEHLSVGNFLVQLLVQHRQQKNMGGEGGGCWGCLFVCFFTRSFHVNRSVFWQKCHNRGVQMLASHKFEPDILKKEGWLEWLDLLKLQQLGGGEGGTNKHQAKQKREWYLSCRETYS